MTDLNIVTPRVVLSGQGGRFEASGRLREMVCLTDDHMLHIVDGYESDPLVLGYQELLRRRSFKVEVDSVTPEQLQILYRIGAQASAIRAGSYAGTTDNQSHRQQAVVAIIQEATKAGASDVHFFPTPNGHQLKFRIHGELELIRNLVGQDGYLLESTIYQSMCLASSVDTNFRPETEQDGRLAPEFVHECGLFGARIATRPTLNGPWMAMRLLYDSGRIIPLSDMGYLDSQVNDLKDLIEAPSGIALLSGITGSGKSTSLQTLMSMLLRDNPGLNLATVEDPIEYRIPGANQTPLLGEWAAAIKNLLRMDPDVLMFGEIRDLLSALAAFQGAQTGHLMLSTLHTDSAVGCVQRLHDLGVENSLLTDPAMIRGLINQSLARVLCSSCKVPYADGRDSLSAAIQHRIEHHCEPSSVFLKGEGCPACKGRGVVGRTAIAEVLTPDFEFMRVFREKGKAEAQNWWVQERGGVTKNAHMIQRINAGLLDPVQAERDVCRLDEDARTLGVR